MASLRTYTKKVFTRFGQFLYLTISNFTKNNLWESASACAFGFIFSFVPVCLIIFTVLVGILKVYPNIYNFVISFTHQIENFVDIQPMLNTVMEMKSLNIFNIFLAVWIVWMARKLFNSIITAMNKVFRSVSKRKSWFNQILTFIIEFALVLIIAVIILATFAFSQLIELPFFRTLLENFPFLYSQFSHNIVSIIMYWIIFSCTFGSYRVVSGTKPEFRRCFFYAALNTASFFLVSFYINKFTNVTNYNTVYGTISSIILLMIKVYFFFLLFLFYAQMVYVSQFFVPLLRSEIYLLPTSESKGWYNSMRRLLFINPAMIQTAENTVNIKKDYLIYREADKVRYVYYLSKGRIVETSKRGEIVFEKGSFIGDIQCILNEDYTGTAIAAEDCELISFTTEEFMAIIEKSHHAARKAISKISDYTASLYDATEEADGQTPIL
ncbi:MAG: YihY/virulence factor BrkB family protein [Treponema sp.]|nr:YihY/virulence factor BrkB family protein [Treponema sp.]